jgi:hypothetical protein
MENPTRVALHSRDPHARMIGRLCSGGDWACANGDLDALGEIADRLVRCSPEATRSDLAGLAAHCRGELHQATLAWVQLKNRALRSASPMS